MLKTTIYFWPINDLVEAFTATQGSSIGKESQTVGLWNTCRFHLNPNWLTHQVTTKLAHTSTSARSWRGRCEVCLQTVSSIRQSTRLQHPLNYLPMIDGIHLH